MDYLIDLIQLPALVVACIAVLVDAVLLKIHLGNPRACVRGRMLEDCHRDAVAVFWIALAVVAATAIVGVAR